MEDREHPFEAFVLETLRRRSAELGQRWAEHTQLSESTTEQFVCALLDATTDGARHRHEPVVRIGLAVGMEAHRRSASLHVMLKELDLLGAILLRAAERAAAEYAGPGATAREGLVVARRIAGATSLLRLAATKGYAQAVEDGLRERYRAIRHDLRNPLGTIKSAIALLTDESVPAEMRESPRVRAMVVRNAMSLDQMINEALNDAAAHLPAFEAPSEAPEGPEGREGPVDMPTTSASSDPAESARQQRDDVDRARQRADFESGAL
jgi:signal transduction histidine kinase